MRLGLRGLGLSSSLSSSVAPSTITKTYAEMRPSVAGSLNGSDVTGTTPIDATKLYMSAGESGTTETIAGAIMAFYVTGTAAEIRLRNVNTGWINGVFDVSIDGANYVTMNKAATTNWFTIFSGLTQARRLIVIRPNFSQGIGGTMFVDSNPTLSVTGAPPSVDFFTDFRMAADGNTDTAWSAATKTGVANYRPSLLLAPSQLNAGNTNGSNVPSIAYKTNATSLLIYTDKGNYIGVSVDGAEPTFYTNPSNSQLRQHVRVLTGLSGTHTYYIWSRAGQSAGNGSLYVAGLGGTIATIATPRRLDSYGHSIVAADISPSVQAYCDAMQTAAGLGMTGSTYGIDSETIANVDARLTALLAIKAVTADDVAILDVGRNDTGTASGTRQSGVVSCVTKLFNKGYGKVIVAGVLTETAPPAANTFAAINDDLVAAVATACTNLSTSNIVYCDRDAWWPINRPDGIHPDLTGYGQMRTFGIADYAALI